MYVRNIFCRNWSCVARPLFFACHCLRRKGLVQCESHVVLTLTHVLKLYDNETIITRDSVNLLIKGNVQSRVKFKC